MPTASETEVGVLRRWSITMTAAAATILAAGAVIVGYLFLPDHRETIIFISAVIGGASTVYAAYFAALALRLQVRRDKQSRSFAILEGLNAHDSAELRVFIEKEVLTASLSPQDLYGRIVDDSDCLSIVTAILGLFEDTSIAIQEDYADEKVLYRSLSFLVPWTFDSLRSYILEERRRTDTLDLYNEFQKLSTAWQGGHFLGTGDKIPREILMRGSGVPLPLQSGEPPPASG